MNREQFRLAIIRATEIIKQHEVYVIGSQAILGTFDDTILPLDATRSREIDVLAMKDPSLVADQFELAGQDSSFDQKYGIYLDGVDDTTASLPRGWQKRVVKFEARQQPEATGWCLERHDLCVAKLAANRDKDIAYVDELIKAGLVDPLRIRQLLSAVPNDKIHSQMRRKIRASLDDYVDKVNRIATISNTLGSKVVRSQQFIAANDKVRPYRCRAKNPTTCRVHGVR